MCTLWWILFVQHLKSPRTPAQRHTHQHLYAHTLCVFVVGPAAHVAITAAICHWHFALYLSSPHWRADRFYSFCSQGNPDDAHIYMHKLPCAIPLSSIHIRISAQAWIPAHLKRSKRDEGTQMGRALTIIYDFWVLAQYIIRFSAELALNAM